MRVRFPWTSPLSDEHPQIEPLRPRDVRDLRLPWLSRFAPDTLSAHLDAYPDLSLWVPRTGEYAVSAQWRRRPEIAELVEVSARKGKPALLTALIERLRGHDYRLALMSDEVWKSDAKLYRDIGFSHLERVVIFQKDLRRECDPPDRELPALDFIPMSERDLDLLLEVDHASFPWLWWNSAPEFEDYMRIPGVHILLALHAGEPVGYVSFTMYNGWAHLDRIAVVEKRQGRKFGAAQLRYVLCAMQNLGAASVQLSTQENNLQSHKLYKSFGFRQTHDTMNFYGLDLGTLS